MACVNCREHRQHCGNDRRAGGSGIDHALLHEWFGLANDKANRCHAGGWDRPACGRCERKQRIINAGIPIRPSVIKPRTLTNLLLSCLLVLTQQLGIAHALSHLASPVPKAPRSDTNHPAEKVCTDCMMFAQLGAALTSSPVTPVALGPQYEILAASFRVFHPELSLPFHSRAPPQQVE